MLELRRVFWSAFPRSLSFFMICLILSSGFLQDYLEEKDAPLEIIWKAHILSIQIMGS